MEQEVLGQTILIESDNIATVSYINKQEGVVSKTLNDETYTLFQWLIPRSITVGAIHRPGVNELADFLLCNRPDPTEWRLLERVVLQTVPTVEHSPGGLIREPPEPSPPLLVLSDRSPIGSGLGCALSQPWTGLSLYAFTPIPLLERTLVKIREDQADTVIVIAPSWPRLPVYIPFFFKSKHCLS